METTEGPDNNTKALLRGAVRVLNAEYVERMVRQDDVQFILRAEALEHSLDFDSLFPATAVDAYRVQERTGAYFLLFNAWGVNAIRLLLLHVLQEERERARVHRQRGGVYFPWEVPQDLAPAGGMVVHPDDLYPLRHQQGNRNVRQDSRTARQSTQHAQR